MSSVVPQVDTCGEIEAAWESIQDRPYVWGGSRPEDGGYDCSGAIYRVQKLIGRPIPRTTAAKYFLLASGPEKHWSKGQCGSWIWWTLSPNRPYGHIGMHVEQPVVWQSGSSTGPVDVKVWKGGHWDRHFEGSKTPKNLSNK